MMAKKNYTVIRTGSYGNAGEVVELDIKELSERQSTMLKAYEKPVVKASESKELAELRARVKELTADNKELKESIKK